MRDHVATRVNEEDLFFQLKQVLEIYTIHNGLFGCEVGESPFVTEFLTYYWSTAANKVEETPLMNFKGYQ